MKNRLGIQCIAFFIGGLALLSCSDKIEVENADINELPVNIRVATADLPDDLQCTMYIFGKAEGNPDYILRDSIQLNNDHRRIMPYVSEEWPDTDYRFLFIALPEQNAGLTLSNHETTDLREELDKWGDIRIKADDTKNISGDCYYGILDKTKQQIADSRLISGEIKRLVGQMAIDIFRTDDNGVAMDKLAPNISNVLDRVYQIDFAYTGLTDEISFDSNGEPVWLATTALTETSVNLILSDTLQLYLDENPVLSTTPEAVAGSARIKNLFCLPSTDNIKLKVTFHYYDTTPICGDVNHDHYSEDGCFVQKTLELNLPQNNDEKEYLDILPNYFTVNKAGLPMDRVIDLLQPGSFGLNTTWENEK